MLGQISAHKPSPAAVTGATPSRPLVSCGVGAAALPNTSHPAPTFTAWTNDTSPKCSAAQRQWSGPSASAVSGSVLSTQPPPVAVHDHPLPAVDHDVLAHVQHRVGGEPPPLLGRRVLDQLVVTTGEVVPGGDGVGMS